MRIRPIIAFLTVAMVCNVQAQWTTDANPTLAGRAGIGGAYDSTSRLRLTEGTGVLSSGPFHLTFGSTSAMWWAFRLDTNNHLHLDRQGSSGWAEGFVFNRDGNFAIGTDAPQQILHAVRDQNAPTLLRVSNASTGAAAYTGLQISEGSTVKSEIRSIGSGFTTASGGANALQVWNLANAPTVFGTNNAERMRINADGTVALNYPGTYAARLMVQHGVDNSSGVFVTHQPAVEANATQVDKALSLQMTENVHAGVTNNGAVHGTHSWTYMSGLGVLNTMYGSYVETGPTAGGTVNTSYGMYLKSVAGGGGTVGTGYGLYVADVLATNDYALFQAGSSDTSYFAGNVVIGGPPVVPAPHTNNALNVQGNANFNGTVTGTNIKAHYQDVAEWVPSTTDLAPGTVVILNRGRNNEVMASATAYDTTVAGVVSAQPGLSLGIEGEGKEQVATTGRVKVRVDARTAAVRVGDLLVTSNIAGTAMRSEPMEINGRQFHQPGTIIGKALEPLEGGIGEILVLLSMQ